MKNSFVVKLAAVALLALGSFSNAQDDTPAPDAVAEAVEAVAGDAQVSVSDQLSESVEGEVVAPVEPVVDGMPLNQGLTIGGTPSDCVGCGQVIPMLPMMTSPTTTGCCGGCGTQSYMPPATYTSYVQPATYTVPVQGCGSCSGTVTPVAYQTPATPQTLGTVVSSAPVFSGGVPATPVSTTTGIVTAAPTPTAPITTTGTVYTQPLTTTSTGCTGCTQGLVSSPAPVATSYAPTTSYATPVTTTGCSGCATPAPVATTCNNCPQPRRLLGGRLLRNRR